MIIVKQFKNQCEIEKYLGLSPSRPNIHHIVKKIHGIQRNMLLCLPYNSNGLGSTLENHYHLTQSATAVKMQFECLLCKEKAIH